MSYNKNRKQGKKYHFILLSHIRGVYAMLKKVLSFAIILAVLLSFSIQAMAKTYGEELLTDKKVKSTEEFYFNITRPEGDEVTEKKSYSICGYALEKGLTVALFYWDTDANKYKPLGDSKGKNSWQVNKSGLFAQEIKLPYDGEGDKDDKGVNKIRVAVYKESDKKEDNLELGTTCQINNFTVTVIDPEKILDFSF